MSDIQKYQEMFDYLAAPELPTAEAPALVFGRKDPLVARAMGQLCEQGLVTAFVISGAYGKDSGDLWDARITESGYLENLAVRDYGVNPYRIYRDERPVAGVDGAMFGLMTMRDLGLYSSVSSVVAHDTSVRRLTATTTYEADRLHLPVKRVHKVPSGYSFDPERPSDRQEAAQELLRVIHWAKQGKITPQAEQPDEDLVSFAEDNYAIPPYPSRLKMAVTRRLPHTVKRRLMTRGIETTAE